jgi:quercetin dioxygenase-like cupin family protein
MKLSPAAIRVARCGVLAVAFFAPASGASAQTRCLPIAQRTGEVGCWITASTPVGKLPDGRAYWYIDSYATRAEANAAKGVHGTVVESLGKIWLFTIAPPGWRSPSGVRVADIGPLAVDPDQDYTAQYMEATFTPGMTAPAHRHSGPEAWYTLSGETCLETPEGKVVGRAGGQHVIVPHGPPMHLTATGTEVRRALVLILHESAQPATTLAEDWKPKGLCRP